MKGETLPGAKYSKGKTRRGYEPLLAIDPHDTDGEWDVLLSAEKMKHVARRGMGATKELIDNVRWSLRNARHIFRGVRDDKCDIDDDDWLCYVATPAFAYDFKTGNRREAYQDEVFLIYVNDERVVYNWYWDKCDPDDPSLPTGYRTRFGPKVF